MLDKKGMHSEGMSLNMFRYQSEDWVCCMLIQNHHPQGTSPQVLRRPGRETTEFIDLPSPSPNRCVRSPSCHYPMFNPEHTDMPSQEANLMVCVSVVHEQPHPLPA